MFPVNFAIMDLAMHVGPVVRNDCVLADSKSKFEQMRFDVNSVEAHRFVIVFLAENSHSRTCAVRLPNV